MAKGKWAMDNWKEGKVSFLQALGISRVTANYPQLNPQLPQQIQQSQSGPPGASGGNAGDPSGNTKLANQDLGKQMAAAQPYNWTGDQWTALNNIVMAESGWDTTIDNGGGHGYEGGNVAYGIPQALPGSKMASAGTDWQTDAGTQIKWMLGYIRSSYGDPVRAWQFHLANGWY